MTGMEITIAAVMVIVGILAISACCREPHDPNDPRHWL